MEKPRTVGTRDRIVKSFATLERLECDRLLRCDPQYRKILEQGIIQRELLDLELQEISEQIDRICAISAQIAG